MYAHQMDVAQPIEMYDKVSAEVQKRLGRPTPEGCLIHLVTVTDAGFRVTEVWDSQEAMDKFGDSIMRPTIESIMGSDMAADGPPPSQELKLHRAVVNEQASSSA